MAETILNTIVVTTILAITIVILHALTRRSAAAVNCTAEPLTRRSERVLSGGSGECTPLADPTVWQSKIVFDLSAAEELLDRAESEGYEGCEMIVLGNSSFLVRWRRSE